MCTKVQVTEAQRAPRRPAHGQKSNQGREVHRSPGGELRSMTVESLVRWHCLWWTGHVAGWTFDSCSCSVLLSPCHLCSLDFILWVPRMVSAALSTAECRWICELNFNFPLLFWRLQQSAHWSGGGRKESLSQGPLALQWAAILGFPRILYYSSHASRRSEKVGECFSQICLQGSFKLFLWVRQPIDMCPSVITPLLAHILSTPF